MKKKVFVAAGALILVVLVLFNLLKKEKGIEVTTEEATLGVVQEKVTGSGQIKAAVEVNVSAQVAGKIIRIYAEEGDRVKKGQLLVELDPEQYQANLERVRSSLMSAKANEKKSHSELERARELFAKNLLSKADLEAIEASYEAAVSNRMQAEAALKEAQDALRKTRLYSDIDGVVTRKNKEVGEMAIGAQFQEDVIMVVSDFSKMETVVEVDENDVVKVKIGDSALVEVDAFPDTVFRGVVTKIAHSAISKNVGTAEQVTNFEVTVTLDHPDPRFRPGMSTTVDILTRKLEKVIRIPIQALTVRARSEMENNSTKDESGSEKEDKKKEELVEVVFVVEDGKASIRPVKVGISDDTHYAVLEGLEEGEEIITGPFRILNDILKNGQLVDIKNKQGKKP